MLWKKILALFVIASSASYAIIQETVDGKHPIPVSFSTSSHNRIAVEDGAVEKVFGDSSIFSVTLDPVTGNAFVNILQEIKETPATLSVITSTGLVQDLLVTSKPGPSEQVLLKEKEEPATVHRWDVSLSPTVHVLNKILEDKVPFGYGQLETMEELELPSPLQVEPLKAFEGPFEKLLVYKIENLGDEPIVLSTDALKKDYTSWAFVNLHELKKNEQAILVLGQSKDESAL
jgi:hypothetical protein